MLGWTYILVVGLGALATICFTIAFSPPLNKAEKEYQKWKKKRDKIEQERKFEQRYRKEQKGD